MLKVKLLGQFDVRRDGTPISIPARAAQSLFAYLLFTAGTMHRREKLAGLLWPDTSDENARKNLRHELWRLRKAIEINTPRKKAIPYLIVDEISIGLNAESDYWLDVAIVQKALATLVSADDLIGTLSLYRGELLPGLYDEWVVLERERVRAVFEQKMVRLLELLVGEKRWDEILDWGERWIALGQTPEPAYRALMLAYDAKGDKAKIALVFQRCVTALRDDLGVEPSEETQILFARLSKSEPRVSPLVAPSPTIKSPTLAPPARATNLPVPLTSFIGREREIEQVKDLLSTTHLLTLIGSGGVGKTRLAIELARELASQYQDGAWWVDLVALSDPALVPQAVAKSLGVREVSNVPLIEMLANVLCARQALLVLDNCEHLVTACAQLADSLLGACSSLKILTTSREALGISGETIWRVPSLSIPEHAQRMKALDRYESVRLFIERARAVKSDFTLTEQNALPIAHVCQRLDGIPLAIELAAARIKLLSPSEIETRLDDRFSLLTTGSRTAIPRHQTIRAMIDWSHELLNEPERILFRRLSVFAGGFTLQAAEEVCAENGIQVLELLGHLIDKSLVILDSQGVTGETRYRLLETIREYAREKLAAAQEADTVRKHHLEYFRELAEEAEPHLFASQATWFYRLEAETDNIRAAAEWAMQANQIGEEDIPSDRSQSGLRIAAALAMFWESRYPREAATLLKQMLPSPRAKSKTIARARALNAAGFLEWSLGNMVAARTLLEEALTIGRETGDQLSIAWALVYLGAVANFKGDYSEVQAPLEEAIALARDLGTWGKSIRGFALFMLGDVPSSSGDYERAQTLYEESVAVLGEVENKNMLAYPLRRLSYLAVYQGDAEKASGLIKASLGLNREVGNQKGTLASIVGIAALCTMRGDGVRAAKLLGAVGALLEAMKSPLFHSDSVEYDHCLARVRTQLGDATFAAAWSEGRAMTIEQAVAYALEDGPSD